MHKFATTPTKISDLAAQVDCPACNTTHSYGKHEFKKFKTWPPRPGERAAVQCKTYRTLSINQSAWHAGASHIIIQF